MPTNELEELKAEVAALKKQLAGWKPFKLALRLEDRQVHLLTIMAREEDLPEASPFSVVPRE